MALRFVLLAAACVQISLASPAGSQWFPRTASAGSAWNIPNASPSLPSWLYAPAGSDSYGTVSPWKTPASVGAWGDYAHSWTEGASEHPWSVPVLAPSSVNTGSPAAVVPLETNAYSSFADKNEQHWNGPSASGSAPSASAVAAAEQQNAAAHGAHGAHGAHAAQLPCPVRLPSAPHVPSVHLPSSSISKNHPLQSCGYFPRSFGPGIAPYAPLQYQHHPLQTSGCLQNSFGPGIGPYAPLQYQNHALQTTGCHQNSFGPGIAPYAPLQYQHQALQNSGYQYGSGLAPYAPAYSGLSPYYGFGAAPSVPVQAPYSWYA